MSGINPAQARAARGMLDWSMFDLAKAARISISTVKRITSVKVVENCWVLTATF